MQQSARRCSKPAAPVPTSPSSRHLHHQATIIRMQKCPSVRATTLLGLASALGSYIGVPPRVTKDWINKDIDHPDSSTDASTSSTVSSYFYNLTTQLHLRSAPSTETIFDTILIFLTRCRWKLIESTPFYSIDFQHRRDYADIILFTNPSARAGYDTKSIFKRSLTGLNAEFSFS